MANKDHPIPPMVHPLSKYWEQPLRDYILVDDKNAIMSEYTFKQLHEYTSTVPSGVYEGKMWRAMQHDGILYGRLRVRQDKPWLLRWWGPSEDPNKCTLNSREIILV